MRRSAVARERSGTRHLRAATAREVQRTKSHGPASGVALPWTLLDLFHELCGFEHFRCLFEQAEAGDEGSPGQRTFTLEAVVDVVSDAAGATLYDVKTDDLAHVWDHLDKHRRQVGLYAHAWRMFRPETPLRAVAIISTSPPPPVLAAWQSGDADRLQTAFVNWNPVVPIPLDDADVAATLKELGDVVDAIESAQFAPPPVSALSRREQTHTFSEVVCEKCDARHSCPSFRAAMSRPTWSAMKTPPTNVDVPNDDGRVGDELA